MVIITRCTYISSQFRNSLVRKDGEALWKIDTKDFPTQLSMFTVQGTMLTYASLFTDCFGRLSCIVAGIGRTGLKHKENPDDKIINMILIEEQSGDRENIVSFFNGFKNDFYGFQKNIIDCMVCVHEDQKHNYSFDTKKLFDLIENGKRINFYMGAKKLLKNRVIAYFTPYERNENFIWQIRRDFIESKVGVSQKDIYFSRLDKNELMKKISAFMIKSKILRPF